MRRCPREIDDRLGVELEALIDQRTAHAVGARTARAQAGACRVGEGHDAVAALGLGVVHGQVGLAQQRVLRRAAPVHGADPGARGDLELPALEREGLARSVSTRSSATRSALGVRGVGQQRGELVTAQADERVALAQAAAQPDRDRL